MGEDASLIWYDVLGSPKGFAAFKTAVSPQRGVLLLHYVVALANGKTPEEARSVVEKKGLGAADVMYRPVPKTSSP